MQGGNGDADTENSLVDTVGEGAGGMNWQSSMEVDALPYGKQIASGNLLGDTASSASAPWQPRGVQWGGGGREARQEGDIYIYTCDWFVLMYGGNQHNNVKQLSSNK